MHPSAIPALLCLASLAGAADSLTLSKFTVVEMRHQTVANKDGTVVQEVIKRFVLKDARIVETGGRAFLTGGSAMESKVDVPGSNWATIHIPLERVVVMVGVDAPADLVARPGILNADLGYVREK